MCASAQRGWVWGEQRPGHGVGGRRVQGLDSVQFTVRDPQGCFSLNFWPGACQTYRRSWWSVRTAPHPVPQHTYLSPALANLQLKASPVSSPPAPCPVTRQIPDTLPFSLANVSPGIAKVNMCDFKHYPQYHHHQK